MRSVVRKVQNNEVKNTVGKIKMDVKKQNKINRISNEEGSFTVEATFICTFIIVVVANLFVIILYKYDVCVLNEWINDVYINKTQDDMGKAIKESECKLNRRVFCIEIDSIEYKKTSDCYRIKVHFRKKNYMKNIMDLLNINMKDNVLERRLLM